MAAAQLGLWLGARIGQQFRATAERIAGIALIVKDATDLDVGEGLSVAADPVVVRPGHQGAAMAGPSGGGWKFQPTINAPWAQGGGGDDEGFDSPTWTNLQVPGLTAETGGQGAFHKVDSAGDPAMAFGPDGTVYYANTSGSTATRPSAPAPASGQAGPAIGVFTGWSRVRMQHRGTRRRPRPCAGW